MKKGFTLIELLAVMAILGIIATITMPVMHNVLNSSNKKAYEEQVNFIEREAENYGVRHASIIEDGVYIWIDDLIEDGLVDQDQLLNPLTGEYMSGCVKVTYNETYNRYIYKYGDYPLCLRDM